MIFTKKKNPDLAELIRAKAGRLISNTNQLFIMMKGLALAYAKDMQEDKEGIFESIDTIKASLKLMAGQIGSLKVNEEKMFKACKDGYLNATDLADYLVKKGLTFRDAHHISARLVKYATGLGESLEDLSFDVYKNESDLFEKDVYQAIDLRKCLNKRSSLGGPSEKEVIRQIVYVEEKLGR